MLIGLSGYARSGKDTVAGVLRPFGFTRYAFADELRDEVYAATPTMPDGRGLASVVDEYGWDAAKTSSPYAAEIRSSLQAHGVNARNEHGIDYWVSRVERRVAGDQIAGAGQLVVVTDVRFRNEAQWIVENGGEVWRVERPGVAAVNGHISEHDLDEWRFDERVANSGSVEDLRQVVTGLLRSRAGVAA